MNRTMRKLLTVVMALALMLSMVAGAFAVEVPSNAFKLPTVKERVEEEKAPAEEEAPVEQETPVEEEDPVEEAPVEEEQEIVEDEPVDEPADGEPAAEETEEEPAGEATDAIGKATVSLQDANGNLNVRAEGDADGELLSKIANGESVTILASENGWTKIRTASGLEGWVASSYLNIEEEPVEEAPAEEEPTEEAPVEEEPTEETPVEEEPAEETPAEEEPTEEIPVEEEPAEEAPAEEEPAEETPVEEEPAKEAPVEEEPTEEAPVEEVPAEEEVIETEPTEEPVEEEPTVEYLTDENGELVLDENGNPIPVAAEEEAVEEEPAVEYLTDAEGNPVLDLNGNPIPAGEYVTDENGELIFDENGNPIPVVEEVEEERVLRQVMVLQPEGETLPLYAEPSSSSAVLAEIPGGETIQVSEINADWSYAIYNGVEGYVLTDKIALMDDGMITPEEEAIIRTISITSSLQGQTTVIHGETVTLRAKLTGFENDNYSIQWVCSKNGGASTQKISGATGSSYSISVTEDNAHWLFGVVVTVHDEAPAA